MNDFKIAIELAKKEEAKLTIGVQQEKILHRTIKYYLEKDEQYHEIKVGKMFADIKKDNLIYEIQTAHFNSLRHKLDVFLPDYQVKVVYPIAYNKTIHLINSLGEISIRKSPKKGSSFALFIELYKIKSYLKNTNLSFKILLIDIDEYRTKTEKKHYHSKGFQKEVQIPTDLIKEYDINNASDIYQLFNEYPKLFNNFTSKEFAKIVKVSPNKANTILNVLYYLDIVERIDKNKNAYIYQIKKVAN